jgi:hypothetical protein
MEMMNELALVPEYPVLSGLERTAVRQHIGSRIIAISRMPIATSEKEIGRYLILQTLNPASVWATWLAEEDAQRIFAVLHGFDPSKEPLLYPELEDRKKDEKTAMKRENDALKDLNVNNTLKNLINSDQRKNNITKNINIGFLKITLCSLLLAGILWIFYSRCVSQ